MARTEQKPQTLSEQQKRRLIETLQAIGVRPRFLTPLENTQSILYTDAAELISLAARSQPELAAIHDSIWDRIIQDLKAPAPLMKDSRGRSG